MANQEELHLLPDGIDIHAHSLTYFCRLNDVRKVRYETTRNDRFEHVKSVNIIISGCVKRHRRRLTWRRTLLVTTMPVRELKVGSTTWLLRLETSRDEIVLSALLDEVWQLKSSSGAVKTTAAEH